MNSQSPHFHSYIADISEVQISEGLEIRDQINLLSEVRGVLLSAWVYIFKDSGTGGGGKLRINLRKVKDLVNNASIMAIFSQIIQFFVNFTQKYVIFSYFFVHYL